jgi:cobalamin synthase
VSDTEGKGVRNPHALAFRRGHGVRRGVPDRVVPARVFLGVGAFVLATAVLYWLTAYEEAGTAMLVLAAILALWCGAYLWLRQRSPTDDPEHVGEPFLPHSSPWPFVIGVGGFLLANGLLVGGWFSTPGAAVLALGIGGFVRESRAR